MIRAAGILFLCGDSALFLRRTAAGDQPDTWCIPGGKLEDGETAEDAAIRETMEEVGREVKAAELRPWTRTLMPAETPLESAVEELAGEAPDGVDFTTFICRVKEQFAVRLSEENDGYAWSPVTAPPLPLHPGVQVSLDRIGMNELGVARAMAAGQLVSPQRYENLWLFAIRITGTGAAYRVGRKEFCWRDPSIYLNDEFLARCNGLDVIWEHPEKALLNHKEFHDRKIGSVFLPYLRDDKPDEVWAIVKIRDDDAAQDMMDNVLSTSPAVNFADPTENDRIKLENGKTMLIEGTPSLLDHIAVVPNGVWDKGGDPTGVDSITVMADSQGDEIAIQRGFDANRLDLLRAHVGALSLKARMSYR